MTDNISQLWMMDVDICCNPRDSGATGVYSVFMTFPPSSLYNPQVLLHLVSPVSEDRSFQIPETRPACSLFGQTIPENNNQMTQMLLWMTIAFSWMTVGLGCSCRRHRVEHYCRDDVVFGGRPVAEYLEEMEPNDINGMRIYTVQVDEIFWSKSSSVGLTTVNITTANNDGLCGVVFTLNTSYVIAANNGNRGLETYLCDGNQEWNSLTGQQQTFLSVNLRDFCKTASRITPASPVSTRL